MEAITRGTEMKMKKKMTYRDCFAFFIFGLKSIYSEFSVFSFLFLKILVKFLSYIFWIKMK